MEKISGEEILKKNKYSLELMFSGKIIESLAELRQLLCLFDLSKDPNMFEVITLNNLANVYSSLNQPHYSLKYLSRASNFVPNDTEKHLKIGTLVNLCSINSGLGYYLNAIKEAFRAIEVIDKEKSPEVTAVLYFNIAVQYMRLNKQKKSEAFFKEALVISLSKLGKKNRLTKRIQKTFEKCFLTTKMKILQNLPSVYRKISRNFNNSGLIYKNSPLLMTLTGKTETAKDSKNANESITKLLKKIPKTDSTVVHSSKMIRNKFLINAASVRTTAVNSILSSFHTKTTEELENRVKKINNCLSTLQNEVNNFSKNSKIILKASTFEHLSEKSENNLTT